PGGARPGLAPVRGPGGRGPVVAAAGLVVAAPAPRGRRDGRRRGQPAGGRRPRRARGLPGGAGHAPGGARPARLGADGGGRVRFGPRRSRRAPAPAGRPDVAAAGQGPLAVGPRPGRGGAAGRRRPVHGLGAAPGLSPRRRADEDDATLVAAFAGRGPAAGG